MTQRNGRARLGMLAALLAALGVVASAMGGDQREARAQGSADVLIVDGAYQPGSILVQAGDTVTWTNTGSTRHTVTADDGSVDSSPLPPGANFSHSFPTAGLFTYHCAIHPEMTGAVSITQEPDPAGGAPVHQVPRTGIVTTEAGQPLLMALLAMAAAMVVGTGADVGRRRPAAVAPWGGQTVEVTMLPLTRAIGRLRSRDVVGPLRRRGGAAIGAGVLRPEGSRRGCRRPARGRPARPRSGDT